MHKETIRIIDAAEALINRLHNESVFNPNIAECNELYLALFAIGRCVESASQPGVEADAESRDFCPACDLYSDCNYCADCGREIRTA